jgi:amino acid transporter
LFAWAFDQVIPEQIAQINERTHTPVLLLGVIAVASLPFLYAAAYTTSFFKYIALSTIVGFPTFVLVGIGAILFPYKKKAAYEASVSNVSFLGLPLMVLFGIGSIAAGLFGAWLWLEYPQLGLPGAGKSLADQLFTTPGSGGLALIATCLIAGAIIFYLGKAWRKSQGIDLSLNYLEIPPE